MQTVEQLEKQAAELDEKRKNLAKKLAAARRQEKQKAEAEARAKEQADAMAFMAYCKAHTFTLSDGQTMSIYEYVEHMMERTE